MSRETPPALPSPEQTFRHIPCLCGVLLIAARAVTRMYNAEFRDIGMETTQHSIMRVIEAIGPMTQSQLGDRLALEKTTTSRNVRILERNGWISLDQGLDKRHRVVSLTPKGRAKLKQSLPHWERAQQRMRDALPDGGFETLRRALPGLALAALDS